MQKSKNALFISYDGMTDPLGQSQVLPYLIGLTNNGYSITLLSCEKEERLQNRGIIEAICTKHTINWQPIMYTRKPPVLSTLKDVRNLKKKAAVLHHKISFDLIHCRSYIPALVGQWMKKEYKVPFIFDMRGFWADERVDGGLWNLNKVLYKTIYNYFKRKEIQFLQEAAAVVSLTYLAKEEIGAWKSTSAPITVIPCCVDLDLFDPALIRKEQSEALRLKADLPENKMILGYVGSLGTWYLLDEMLALYKTWLLQKPDSILFFVSNEPGSIVMEAAQKQGINSDSIRVVSAARAEMPYYISMMDFGLFFIKKAYSKKASSPVKQGELMAMGVSVICNAGVGDSDLIINKYQSGELVYSFDEAGYSDAIQRLLAAPKSPEAIRAGAVDYFDLHKGIETYVSVYEAVIKG